jgi:serine/threonine-protein kinase RsbW
MSSHAQAVGFVERYVVSEVTEEKTELVIPSRIESIEEVAQKAAEVASRSGVDETAMFGIDMAVREAVANAVKHGNKFDETKNVTISFTNSSDAFVVVVSDQGAGFNPEDVPDPTSPENLLKASGRGIFFMHNFMDEVEWSHAPEGGTIVRLAKRK